MKRLGMILAATVLMGQASVWGTPVRPSTEETGSGPLKFRPSEKAHPARPAAACTGMPKKMCICYKLNCKGQNARRPLPPSPPPPPPPPPAPAAELPGKAGQTPTASRSTRSRAKRFRARFTFVADMLPFQFDVVVSRHVALSLSFAAFASGKKPWYYLGGFFGLDYFPKGPAPKGFRISIRGGRLIWGKKKISDEKGSLNVFRLTAGYNWVWDNGFTLGLGFGKQLIHRGYKDSDRSLILFIPHMEFNLGVAF